MNKKLIALAVAGALTAPMAAQAEATIYGKMHLSVDAIDNDCVAPTSQVNFISNNCNESSSTGVSSNSSRIGFKGAEDLGGGLSAVWQVESTVNLSDNSGGTAWAGRNSFVGLAGGFGTVVAGRHDTPYKTLGRKVELFGDTVGDSRSVINQSGTGHDARTNNTIAYISPNMSGLTAVLAYVTDADILNKGTGNADDNDYDAYSMSLTYDNGPLLAGIAHQSVSVPMTGADDATATRIAGSYAMGSLKVAALIQQEQAIGGNPDADRDSWGLGLAYKMGNNTIKGQYYVADEVDGTDNTGYDLFALGVDHSLSKKTKVYAVYSQISNDDNASASLTGKTGHGDDGLAPTYDTVNTNNGNVISAGNEGAYGDPSAFSVGIVHKF